MAWSFFGRRASYATAARAPITAIEIIRSRLPNEIGVHFVAGEMPGDGSYILRGKLERLKQAAKSLRFSQQEIDMFDRYQMAEWRVPHDIIYAAIPSAERMNEAQLTWALRKIPGHEKSFVRAGVSRTGMTGGSDSEGRIILEVPLKGLSRSTLGLYTDEEKRLIKMHADDKEEEYHMVLPERQLHAKLGLAAGLNT